MAGLLVAWVACPALLLALFTAIGAGVARLSGGAVPLALVPACGLAAATAAGGVLAGTAPRLIVPGLVALAVIGGLAGRRSLARPDPWALAAVAAALSLYAVPIVLSGEATFAGYIKLDDTATWLALTDRVMDGGTGSDGLPPSTYEATLAINSSHGYPVGAFVPLGLASELLGTDPAWLFQPYLAVCGALLALALWELCRRAVASPPLRAVVATVAASPALLVGYYLWGGLKELLTAALVATVAAAAAAWAPAHASLPAARSLVPLGALVAGLAATGSAAAAVWAAPALSLVALRLVRALGPLAWRALAGAGAGIALTVGAIVAAGARLSPLRGSFTNQADLGNLAEPLEPAQLAGIWPASDLRFDPGAEWLAFALVALALLAAAAGTATALLRGDARLALYSLGTVAVCAAIALVASPWLDAKAFAVASPAVLVAALAGLAGGGGQWRPAAFAGLALLAAGVGWSLVTQWGGANLAPRAQLAELEVLGDRLAGHGPTLMTEYQPYGVRHFLRAAEPEGASELRRRRVALVGGGTASKGDWVDTDELRSAALAPYQALVLRRSPAQSRPPAAFALTWHGEHYELWERDPDAPAPVARLPLGAGARPASQPRCSAVRSLGHRAGPGGSLVAAAAPRALEILPSEGGAWNAPGRPVEAWVAGSLRGTAALLVDGEPVAERRHRLNNEGLYTSFGMLDPPAGEHRVRVERGGADLHPGSAPDGSQPGRIVLRDPSPGTLRRVAASTAGQLCGRAWDWIEALRPEGPAEGPATLDPQ